MTDYDIRNRRVLAAVATLAAAASVSTACRAGAQTATAYRPFAAQAEEARVAANWPEYARLVDSVYRYLGNHPSILWARARAAARLGQPHLALERLRTFAAAGLVRDVSADSAFLSLASSPDLAAIRTRIERNGSAASRATVAFTFPDSSWVPEGLAYDADSRRFLTSSITRGVVSTFAPGGTFSTLTRASTLGVWSPFGLAIDPRRRVAWVASQAVPHGDGYASADSGKSGVAAFDLASGRLTRRLVAPAESVAHAFGDVAVADDGTVFVADGATGAVYLAAPNDSALRALVPPGALVSAQGIALADGERAFYVADYARGIALVDRSTGRVELLAHEDSIVPSGVDGMIRVGRSLFAVQNGTAPKRIVRFDLDSTGRRLLRAAVLESNEEFLGETTQIVRVGDTIYFTTRTGLDLFDDDGRVRKGEVLQRARIGALPLR